ncbi:T22C5.20 [Arabidopsis thaliana]|uniref:T22C5.20 n=1 Tax=Arabidopsis thaliana TaxID=3702 RepID=Q9SFY4_ARATH|nr:T22C5.20 [Arabidopsis thaliana]
MACAEQPIKKRRLYESIPESHPPPPPQLESQSPSTVVSSFPAPVTPSPPSQEEIQTRSRNREEIRRVHDCYKRLKSCVAQRDGGGRSANLEQAYRSLISASRGCTSVKRLVADLVPRYALYCPTAIGDAVQAVIDMHNFSLEALKRGQDADGVAFQTAKACIFGLVDLCSAALSKKTSSPGARDICSAVFRNVLTFFVLSFEGKNIFQIVDKSDLKLQDPDEIFSQLMQKLSDGNSLPLIKLSQFRVLALLKVFFNFPKKSIATCFGFFNSSSTEDVATGRYLITHMTEKINDIDAASIEPEVDENSGQTGSNNIEATGKNAEGLNGVQEASNSLTSCLLEMVIRKSSSIGRWAFFQYKKICSLSSFVDISSAVTSLEGIFGFVGKNIKLEDCQMDSDEDDYGKFSVSHVKPHSSADNDVRSSAGSVYDAGGSRSMDFETVDQRDLSCGRSSVPRGLLNQHTPSPSARGPSDLRSNSTDRRNNFVLAGSPVYQAVPHGPSSGQIAWYLDGDPTAFDIFPASGQLWLGYLGPDETEGHLRFQLDRYGPVDRFFFDPVKGFALAEYRSIIDAIRAREYLRAQFPWRIKFMDIGVGARGSLNGVAYGYCTHLYIGGISSQWERDEIVHESRQALYKGPRMVTDLYYEHALLMEFDTPDDAAIVMAHLRFFRGEKSKFHLASINRPLPHEDGGSHPERHLQVPPSSKQDSGSGEYVSPLMSTDNHCNSVPPGATFQQNWPAAGSTLVNSAQGDVYETKTTLPQSQELLHVCPYQLRASLQCLLHRHLKSLHLPTSSQMQGPPAQQVSGPFMPPPVHPVSQPQGPQVQQFDQLYPPPPLGHSLPSVLQPPLQPQSQPPEPPPEMMPPPPQALPPPLPHSHPPLVPPPPFSPLLSPRLPPMVTQLCGSEASKQNIGHQWQGALSKSGVHYSTIIAQRLESDICKYIIGSPEPVQWPVKLDMTKRTDMKNVKATFANTQPHKLQDFITYLKQRDCAGVIKIPASSPMWARHLFILPHSQETCSLLSVSPSSSECLIETTMSNRRSNRQDENTRYVPKGHQQQKFVPKPMNPTPTSNSTPFPVSLSSSLRQSDSSGASSRVSASGGSRVRIGDQGQLVSSKSPAQGGGSFVNYLPQDEAVAAGLGPDDGGLDPVESQGVVDLLNRELTRLLKLNPRDFWREVASDASLHDFLDSFLQFRSRWYDFPFHGVKDRPIGIPVLKLLIASVRKIMKDKKLLDLPKLLDICAIYGHENAELTKSLTLVSSANSEDHGRRQLHSDLLEVMDFINDGVVSLDAFISAYTPAVFILACPVETSYGSDELLRSLVRLHDSLLPSLHRGFQVLFKDEDHDSLSDISTSLNMLSTRIGSLCWKILDICYLSNDKFNHETSIPAVTKMFPSRVEDPMVRADILIQTFREISGLSEQSLESKNRLLQKIEKNYRIIDRLRSLQNAGWISMEDEQLQYLSMIMLHSADTFSMKESPLLLTDGRNAEELMDENAVVMQSKISQIKDIFPEYGNGFLAACLEAYNQNPEEVIQRILEGTLHEDLQRLDTSLETMPQPKSAPTLRSKDKGKGKLIESDTSSSASAIYTEKPITRPSLPASSASSATVGRFVRKPKDDTPSYKILDARKESDRERNAALLAQYEYDDEYDDSFDDLGLSIAESGTEESGAFGNRAGSEPSDAPKWGSRKNPQFYVKDGKNYSYKVAGAVAVANANEASLVNEAEGDKILGLGRGGNIPLGAVRKLTEYQAQRDEKGQSNVNVNPSDGRENGRNWRGVRGRGRGVVNREQPQEKSNESSNNNSEVNTEAENGGGRGRGRGRRGGGGGRNHNHKDRAMKKHIASVSGF